ncbi:MAG: hypothetical protein WD049_05055 [Candidatus Paceibacterota bacterium]
MSSKGIVTVVVIIFVIGLGIFFLSQSDEAGTGESATSTDEMNEQETSNGAADADGANGSDDQAVVRYTAGGFEPGSVVIEQGETVQFVNESGRDMWVASAMHPTHEAYAGTTLREHCPDGSGAFDQCEVGDQFSFTFEQVGEWNYHNHANASHFGTVVVE